MKLMFVGVVLATACLFGLFLIDGWVNDNELPDIAIKVNNKSISDYVPVVDINIKVKKENNEKAGP